MEDRLIVAVSVHPELYDKSLVDYKDNRKKAQIWENIGSLLGIPADTCQKKWKNMLDTYRKHRKKNKEKKSGSGHFPVKEWHYMRAMSFMAPFVVERDTSGNLGRAAARPTATLATPPAMQGTTSTPRPPDQEESPHTEDNGTQDNPISPHESSEDELFLSPPRKVRRHRGQEQLTFFESSLLQAIADTPAPSVSAPSLSSSVEPLSDPDEMFFMSLVPTVKAFSAARKSMVKFKIHQIIHEAEVEALRESD